MSSTTKLPDLAESRRLTPETGRAVWEWADSKPFYGPDLTVTGLSVYTPEGRVKAEFGDWIVKDANGGFWAYTPEMLRRSPR